MAVDGSEIGEAHLFKKGVLEHEPLDAVLEALQILGHAAAHRARFQSPDHEPLQAVVAAAGTEAGQAPAHGAHVPGDGHLVVVEDHHQGELAVAPVVQGFVGKAAGQGPVADDGGHMTSLMQQILCPHHAQSRRDGGAGVAGVESVVGALLPLGEARDAPLLAQVRKGVPPPGQYLMGIGLMAHVEDEPILLVRIHPMQGDDQVHRPQTGRQVTAVFRHAVHHIAPYLFS